MNRTISMPEELLKRVEEWAARERLPVEEFLCPKLSEKLAGLEYLKQRADRGSIEKSQAALRSIPDAEPEEYDRF